MSKRCPSCGHVNGDERLFCSGCGGPLDGDLKLIMDLEKRDKGPSTHHSARADDGDDYVPPVPQAKKKSPLPWILLACVVILAVVLWLVLS